MIYPTTATKARTRVVSEVHFQEMVYLLQCNVQSHGRVAERKRFTITQTGGQTDLVMFFPC